MKRLNYSQKMSLTAGSAALLAPAIGQAVLVFNDSNDLSISHSGNQSAEWDVDGAGAIDFDLRIENSNFFKLDSFGYGLNGRGMVNKNAGIGAYPLTIGFTVGPVLAYGYNWGETNVFSRDMLFNYGSYNLVGEDFINASIGSNFIGFGFDIDGNTHYGWAEIILGIGEVTINQWAYDDVADTAINVGQTNTPPTSAVPEPSSLALLAAGAAGLARLRRRKHNAKHQA